MSLRPTEASLLARELERELPGAVVQQVSSPTSTRVYLELRVPGRSDTVLFCSDEKAARVSVVEKRPPNPPTPPGWQSVLRRELVGARVLDVESIEARRVLILHLRDGAEQVRALVLEYGDSPGITLTTREGRVLALSSPFRPGFRHGAIWTPPDERPVSSQPSRLESDVVRLRLLHGAEQLFGAEERTRWKRAQVSPLETKLKRLERTRAKVLAEAGRTEQAELFKREGELLSRNVHRLTRGLKEISLTEYGPEGTSERVIRLDPARAPKEEAEWRFHQYRRLLRGVEFAKKRLEQLDREKRALEAELERVRTEPPEAPSPEPARHRADETPLLPYKEYRGHHAQKIWVGRGSTHNDTLTFKVARPWHVWLHARGVPGAHVIVPLDKQHELQQETLLDAAHLALHHSDLKGEPRGEVSYVQVKYVRKPKGAAPGAVTYVQERTLNLRVEPLRLERLLATETLERS